MRVQLNDVVSAIQEHAKIRLGAGSRSIEITYTDPVLDGLEITMTLTRTGWFYAGDDGTWRYDFHIPRSDGQHYDPHRSEGGFGTMGEALRAGVFRVATHVWNVVRQCEENERNDIKHLKDLVGKDYERLMLAGIASITEDLYKSA